MKNILLLCACLLALAAPLRGVAGPPDIVVVRVYCHFGSPINAVVTRAEGKSELVDFKYKYSTTNLSRANEQLIQDNEAYYKLCHQFYQEGYILQSTVNIPSNNYDGYTTLFFVKAP